MVSRGDASATAARGQTTGSQRPTTRLQALHAEGLKQIMPNTFNWAWPTGILA